MQTLKEKIFSYNENINRIQSVLARIAGKNPSFSLEELAGKTDKQISEVHAEKIEEQLEAISAEKKETEKKSLADILAEKRRKAEAAEWDIESEGSSEGLGDDPNANAIAYSSENAQTLGIQESFALDIVLNERQLMAKEMGLAGKSFCLIGAAGTGKTTTQREVARTLLQDKRLSTSKFKHYDENGARAYISAPSIAFCAYTRRAAANLAKAIWKDKELEEALFYNVMTIHSLLEYEPETYWDPVEMKEKFRFAPMRTATAPLDITHLIIEESSMLGLDLWENLYDALPSGVQIIFIGDINQLPPVFGPSILNYALVQLPIVELTEVYRNQGIILENAHNILAGKPLKEDKNFQIVSGKNESVVGQHKTATALAQMFETLYNTIGDDGLPEYDPETCIILSPFNKQGGQGAAANSDGYHLGTDSVNKWIAQFVGAKRGAIVHEVIAGFNKVYLAVGDKVMFNKRDGVITEINRNSAYHGKEPQMPGSDLSRFGHRIIGAGKDDTLDDLSIDYSNFSLESLEESQAERKQQATHTVTIDMGEGRTETLSAAGDFAPAVFSLGYCLTVHKSQGSEWRKVFIIFHKDHSIMLFRELFYTAVTRARTKVTIIAKRFLLDKAIRNQRIKGDTVADKIEYFNSGINDLYTVLCTKD